MQNTLSRGSLDCGTMQLVLWNCAEHTVKGVSATPFASTLKMRNVGHALRQHTEDAQ